MKITAGSLELHVIDEPGQVAYEVWEGRMLRTRYTINLYRPGWKRVSDEMFAGLIEVIKELESEGRQSPLFGNSRST